MVVLVMSILQHQQSLLIVYARKLLFYLLFFHLILILFFSRPGFAGSRCELGKKKIKSFSRYFCTSKIFIEYFRCPTNGFYADAYGCAQGKYFECVEQSLLFIFFFYIIELFCSYF